MALFNKIFNKKKEIKTFVTRKDKKFSKKISKNIFTKSIINNSQKPMAGPKIYSKDDIFAIPLQENIKSRSRSHSISYDLRPTFNSTITPDEKTFRQIKNINIKVNVFWGEEYKKEQVNLSIPRTGSYNLLKKLLSERLGYKMPHDFSILYHTRRYHKNNTIKRVLLDYWIMNKILWCVDNDFMFRKHMLLWRDNIEITVVKKSIIDS
ncbi:hypothetical protein C1645_737686 [Glomus cerebriforme]|uniref:Uncharacterized protein n=1 Tax=Glomus cerebriforme TaxID=658196 RepID=A0A397T1C2_9GLOM|nr:hypothetical protein C1645_737686 [Glomus cerebriforme]